jgi:PAS domain S-box-containing protein
MSGGERRSDAGARDADAEIERLTGENLMLQARVADFHLLEQHLLESKHMLELESTRFERMRAFIRAGVRPCADKDFAILTCESMVDVLECEHGLFWCLRSAQDGDCLYQSGDLGLGTSGRSVLGNCLASWVAEARGSSCSASSLASLPASWPHLPESLGIGDFLAGIVTGDEGEPIGVLIAANSLRNAGFYEPMRRAAVRPFSAFVEQVGAILESRRQRSVVQEQAARLRLSEQRLALALERSNVGLWDLNVAEGRVFYSEQWKRQLGYQGDEISDSLEEWRERLHPDDRQAAQENALAFSRSPGVAVESTFRMRHRDGSWRWIISRGSCLADAEGVPVRMIGTHIDITPLKRIEDRLREAEESQRAAREHAESANLAKSDFLAKISHEVRTPLHGALAAFQMLQGMELSDEARKLVEMGDASGRWMLDIIGESLDIARIEAGRMELDESDFLFGPLIAEVAETASIAARKKKIQIRWKIGSGLPAGGFGDRSRIKQVIANLVDNAIKFTGERGRVVVAAGRIGAASGKPARLRFRVADTGAGMSEDDARNVFKPFYQAGLANQSRGDGVGLGLAICRELVTLMGGEIVLTSRLGKGSVFTVTLPDRPAFGEIGTRHQSGGLSSRQTFSGRVLFAEDNEISRNLGVMLLEKLGLEVVAAVDGRDALDQLARGSFDLAILDCWMPHLGGIEVATRIRRSEVGGHRAMPILALTANAEIFNVSACLEAGMDACLFKPLVIEKLLESLALYLPKSELGSLPSG